MTIKAVVPVLIVILLVGCAACCGGQSLVPNGMTAAELIQAAISAEENIDTLQFDGSLSLTMMGETLNMELSGAVDEPNREMNININSIEQGESVELYIVDDWMYMKVMGPNMSAMWNKTPLTQEIWDMRNIPDQQLNALLDFAQVKYLTTEVVGTTECYRLEVTPELERLLRWATGEEDIEGIDPEAELEDIFPDFSITVWIATDTYHIVKTSIGATMPLDWEFAVMTITQVITVSRSHFNEPVSIELPEDAEDAEAVPVP